MSQDRRAIGNTKTGETVWVSPISCSHRDGQSGVLVRFGGEPEDWWGAGRVSWCPECDGPTWELVTIDPLHIEPSIHLAARPGEPERHGYIRGGKWEDA